MLGNKKNKKRTFGNKIWAFFGAIALIGAFLADWGQVLNGCFKNEEKKTVSGTVLDSGTNQGIYKVKVIIKNDSQLVEGYTDSKGDFLIDIVGSKPKVLNLTFYHKDYFQYGENVKINFSIDEAKYSIGGKILLEKKKKNTTVLDTSALIVQTREIFNPPTFKIGNTIWMAVNLYQNNNNLICYDSLKSCEDYGRLYTWDQANRACPKGWKLTSWKDWELLKTSYNYINLIENKKFDDKAFGGYYNNEGFKFKDKVAAFWTKNIVDGDIYQSYQLDNRRGILLKRNRLKTDKLSCRCVKKI